MPDFQGRKDFPEVADDKINIGGLRDGGFLVQRNIYSPKEEPVLQDKMLVTPEEMLKDIFSMIAGCAEEDAELEKSEVARVNALVDDYMAKKGFDLCQKCGGEMSKCKGHDDLEKGIIESIDSFFSKD